MTRLRRLAIALVVAVLAPLGLASCAPDEDHTLHVLAGSEVKDLAPILEAMERETGIHLDFEYMGTLDGTEALLDGGGAGWDASWFPSNRYLSLFPEGASLAADGRSIMRSPVVLGLKQGVAARLGWDAARPTWQQVVDAAGSGALRFGMTSPVSSNSGFTTLVEAATALSGTGTVLQDADIATVTPALVTFAGGQTLASGSSGWLAEKFASDSGAADGIFNYESVLAGMAVDGQPLDIVIPSDGVVTSDYPLTLLKGVSDRKREGFEKVVAYLTRADVQQRIADETHRRTTATPPATDATVFELPFPAKLETVQSLLTAWVGHVRKPSNMVFQIDTSGSMAGGRMDDLKAALRTLSGEDATSGSGRFLTLQPRERIALLEFAASEKSRLELDIPDDDAGYQQAMTKIGRAIDGYDADGGTAIYSTLQQALTLAEAHAGPDAITSVVVFTDGENTSGDDFDAFERWYRTAAAADPTLAAIPVYSIVFGDGNSKELTELAEMTHGRAFDAKSQSLSAVFREIRGYL